MLSANLADAGAPRRHKRGGKHTQQNKPQSLRMGMWGFREVDDDAISLGPVAVKALRPHEVKLKSRAECIAAQHQHAMSMAAVAANEGAPTSPSQHTQWYDIALDDESVLHALLQEEANDGSWFEHLD